MVSESDTNYEAAQNLMKQIEEENKEKKRSKIVESDALITEAGELLRQGQYKDAIAKNTEGYSLREDMSSMFMGHGVKTKRFLKLQVQVEYLLI